MAENNSSAPLKTAEGAAHCLPEPDAWRYTGGRGIYRYRGKRAGFASEYQILKPEPLYTAEQMSAYAAQAVEAQAPAAVADEMSPEFTDTARAGLMWVLWHHQGSSSEIGTAMRFALGMGKFDRLNDHQLSEAKRWAEIKGVTKAVSTGVAAPSKHLALQWCAGALQGIADEKATVRLTGFGETLTIGAILDMADKALATPALPATEDSSAVDLAEVQVEPVAWLLEGGEVVEFEPQSYHAGDEWTPLYTAPQAQPADALDAQHWRDHIGKLDALVTYCPTCCQGFTAKPEMTRDEVIFECGKTAGRSAAMTKEGK